MFNTLGTFTIWISKRGWHGVYVVHLVTTPDKGLIQIYPRSIALVVLLAIVSSALAFGTLVLPRAVPAFDGGEGTHSSWVVNAVADVAVVGAH